MRAPEQKYRFLSIGMALRKPHLRSHHTTSHHITLHHTTSHHITPHHSTSQHITPHHTIHWVDSLGSFFGSIHWVDCLGLIHWVDSLTGSIILGRSICLRWRSSSSRSKSGGSIQPDFELKLHLAAYTPTLTGPLPIESQEHCRSHGPAECAERLNTPATLCERRVGLIPPIRPSTNSLPPPKSSPLGPAHSAGRCATALRNALYKKRRSYPSSS